MTLAKLAIRQPIFIGMVLLAITLVGAMSYMNMGVDLYPDISNPFVSVSIPFPGASPEDVETMITKPVERTLSSVNGIDSISANSREGMAMIGISFKVGYDIQVGAQEVRERLDTIKRSLPDDAGEPILRRFDPNSQPFMTVAFTVQGAALNPVEMRRIVEEIIVPRLERLPGVAAANVNGLRIQEIGVELNAAKLKALRISPQQVISALKAENAIMPSGRVAGTTEDVPLRTSAEFRNLDEINKVVVARQGSRSIQLQEVATVAPRLPERQSQIRIDGKETLVIELQKVSGSNVVGTAHLAREEFKSLSRDFSQLVFNIVRDDSTFIEESDRDVTFTLILGAILAAIIVFLFIRNVRNTLITVAGLPVVVIGTFAVISLLGFTRNIITLMALSLSIGLLIDDAIVVRENIFRHMENGASPREAAEKATGEIAFAVLAITLTIVAVFIPVAFTTGQVGRLFKEFGITVALAVLISLFEAFTFAPLLSAYVAKPLKIKVKGTAEGVRRGLGALVEGAWQGTLSGYKAILVWSLRFRWVVVGGAVAIFAVSLWLVTLLPMSFFPSTDPGMLNVGIQLPPGSTLEKTDEIAREVERVTMAQPEVKQIYARVSRGSGNVSVYLKDDVPTEPVIKRLRESSLAQYGRTLAFNKPQQFLGVGGGGGGFGGVRGRPVVLAVRGPIGLEELDATADQVIERLRTVPGLRDLDKSLPPREPELQVMLDRQRTANTGVSAATVAQTVRSLVQGTTATQIDWQEQRMDLTVQLRKEDRSDESALKDILIAGSGGELWPLQTVARIERGSGPTLLERQDRQRQILIGANLEGRTQGAVVPDIQKTLAAFSLPAGVSWRFSGPLAQTESAFAALIVAMILALVFIYMVLASQFGSVIHPFTVMVAIPMSAIGAMLALVGTRSELTVVSVIGIILLMGLATKNSILLVDFILRYRREGRERTEAVIAAGPVRLRPILMTTFAIILGMVPTALGIGAAGEFRAPMAIAVMGGVFSSTLLSLVVVPVVYTLVDDAVSILARLFRGAPATAPSKAASLEIGTGWNSGTDTALNGVGKRRSRWHWFYRNHRPGG